MHTYHSDAKINNHINQKKKQSDLKINELRKAVCFKIKYLKKTPNRQAVHLNIDIVGRKLEATLRNLTSLWSSICDLIACIGYTPIDRARGPGE